MDSTEISRLIEAGLPDASARVASNDNTHFEAIVIAAAFAGKRPLARHQLVYQSLGQLVGNEIHALSIRAYTPDEWQQVESATQAK
jgi:acid stress-induced BolA-like protein IbaG/YrbA